MALEHERLIRKLESATALTEDEKEALRGLPSRVRRVEAETEVVREGSQPSECCVVVEGFLARQKTRPNGARPIMSLHVPGDTPDLQSLYLKTMDHGVGALTQSTVAFIPHGAVHELIRRHAGIATALWRETLTDAAIFREWVINVGSRSAHSRAAHLLCEYFVKMQVVGLTQGDQVRFPLTQRDLGDALGLSVVHVNRTLQQLRAEGLITLSGKVLTVLDFEGLKAAGEFDPQYLHLERAAA